MNTTQSKVRVILSGIFVTVLFAGAFYFQTTSEGDSSMPKLGITSFIDGALATTAIKGEAPIKHDDRWSKYENQTYGYLFRYPSSAKVQTIQSDTQPKNTITTEVSGPEANDYVTFTTWVKQPEGDGYGRLATAPIKTFAQAMRMKEVNTADVAYPNKKVGDLEEIFFAGYRGYAVTVNNSSDGHGSSNIRYIYLDAAQLKLVIQYSLDGKNADTLAKTFRFTR